MYHIFFIHSSVDGQLGCFHVLAAVNSGAVYLFQLVFLFLSDVYPGVELLGPMGVLFLVFWVPFILLSTVAAPVYIPTNSAQGVE